MAESEKRASSSVNPNDKSSLLDVDIGKEFLSSWNTDDDTMDFSFDTVSGSKKKSFNFDKLDMDFSLDGNFDKLASFKVDMPDLDFSSPSKKAATSKEKSGGEPAGGSCQRRKDCFTFSFDFNELDSFSLDSDLMKGKKTSGKTPDIEGIALESSDIPGSKFNAARSTDLFGVRRSEKHPQKESVMSSVFETHLGDETGNSSIDGFPSISGIVRDLVVPCGARTLTDKITKETDRESCLYEKTTHTEQQTARTSPVQSLGGNESTRDISDEKPEGCSLLVAKANAELGEEHIVNSRMISGVCSKPESSQPKISASLHDTGSESTSGGSKMDAEIPTKSITETGPVLDDLDLELTSTASLKEAVLHDCKTSKDKHNPNSQLVVPSESESVVDKATPIKEKESGVVHSKFFKRSEETGPQVHEAASTTGEVSSSGSKGTATTNFGHPTNGKREGFNSNNAQTGRTLVGDSKQLSKELTIGKPAFLESEKGLKDAPNAREGLSGDYVQNSCKLVTDPEPPRREVLKGNLIVQKNEKTTKDIKIIRQGFNSGDRQNGCKLVINPRSHNKGVAGGDPVMLGSEKNSKELNKFDCDINPASSTDTKTKSNTQTSLNSTILASTMKSIQKSHLICVKGLKTVRRTPDLSCLKISGTVEASKDKSNAPPQMGTSSFRLSQENMELQGHTASKIVHPVANIERKTPLLSSLKRKASESSNAELVPLNPLKRLSQSCRESRNLKDPEEIIVEKEAESKTINNSHEHLTSGFETPQVILKELEIPLAMENDGIVEKAEAYAKDLEDICNMLKKKHEEAKELLVRAIVNNNNLLILNHPIFDEKIRMVQKFAALLVSN